MALGLAQPLTEMSTWNHPSVSRLSGQNVGDSTSHNPMGLQGLLQGWLFHFFYLMTEVEPESEILCL
jgi:hypothetical protein